MGTSIAGGLGKLLLVNQLCGLSRTGVKYEMQSRCIIERTTDVQVCVHVMYVYRYQCVYMSLHAYMYISH